MNSHDTTETVVLQLYLGVLDMSDEQILYRANPVMFRDNPIGFILTITLSIVVVGIPILVVWWLRCKGASLTITDKRTIQRRGILSKSLNEVWHRDVRSVKTHQSFFNRMFGVGAIGISSAGQSGIEISMGGIPGPEKAKSLIDQHRQD